VGAASGRVDALAFIAGLIAGVRVFAETYLAFGRWLWSGELGSVTLGDVLGVPFWVLAAVLVAMTVALAFVLRRVERPPAR
jgi:hypothetical protein